MPGKGTPFTPDDPRAGRPKGALNKTSRDARQLAQGLVTDPAYLERLKTRLLDGKLDGAMERLLWQYAFGSAPDHPISIMDDFFDMPPLRHDADA
jgi:hypothetical protein